MPDKRNRRQRQWRDVTIEEIKEAAKKLDTESVWHDSRESELFHSSDVLAGKKLSFVFEEGLRFSYEFKDDHWLSLTVSDGRRTIEYYNALPAPGYPDIIFLHHYVSTEIPGSIDLIFDRKAGTAVMLDATFGHPFRFRQVTREIRFGGIEGMELPPEEERYHFTDELTGKSVWWRHPEGKRRGIKYIFSSDRYYTYYMRFPESNEYWMATNPADYIHIRDDLFLFSVVEERQAGFQLTMLMNFTLLTDIQSGFGYGGSDDLKVERLETVMRSGRVGTMDEMACYDLENDGGLIL